MIICNCKHSFWYVQIFVFPQDSTRNTCQLVQNTTMVSQFIQLADKSHTPLLHMCVYNPVQIETSELNNTSYLYIFDI